MKLSFQKDVWAHISDRDRLGIKKDNLWPNTRIWWTTVKKLGAEKGKTGFVVLKRGKGLTTCRANVGPLGGIDVKKGLQGGEKGRGEE